MSFLPTSGIIYAGENFDNSLEEGPIAPDESDTLSAAVSEVTADEASLTAANDQIDAADAAADGLENVADAVEQANDENDGISEETAEIVEAAVESILRLGKIGVSAKKIGLPSTESFRRRSNRRALGVATVESLRETAKNIWKHIIDAIRKSIDWVRGFFNKIFGAAERLEKRALALKEKAKDLGSKKEDADDIENDSLYNGILVNKAVVTTANLRAVRETATKLYGNFSKEVERMGEVSDITESETFDHLSKLGFTYVNKNAPILKRIDSREGTSAYISPELPGQYVVYMTIAKPNQTSHGKVHHAQGDSKDSAERISSYFKAGSVKTSEGKAKEDTTLKILDKGTISEFADEVAQFANEIVKYKKELPKAERTKDKYIKKLEAFMREEGTKQGAAYADKKGSDVKKIVRTNASIFRKLMDEPAATFSSKSITGMAKALEYAERSASAYETN